MKPEDATSDQEVFDQLAAPARSLGTAAMLAVEQGAYRAKAKNQDEADITRRQTRELRSRSKAELAMAKAELENVFTDGWIDRADAAEISRYSELANSYASRDEKIQQASETIGRQVRERYGIDVRQYPDTASLAVAMEESRKDHAAATRLEGARQTDLDKQAAELNRADLADAELNREDVPEERQRLREEREKDQDRAGASGQDADRLGAAAERMRNAGHDEEAIQDTLRVETTHTAEANTVVQSSKGGKKTMARGRNRSAKRARNRVRSRGRGR